MKQRKFKFSLGMKIASILCCIALVSVGFASWWIVQLPETVTKNGSFAVYEVDEKNITMSTPDFANSTIRFGGPSSQTETTWLFADTVVEGADATENLTSTLSFTLSVDDAKTGETLDDFMSYAVITFTPNSASKSKFDAAMGDYITGPAIKATYTNGTATVELDTVTYNKEADGVKVYIPMPEQATTTVTLTFTFGWGAKFDGKNPYDYYNGLDYNTTNVGNAKTDLGYLETNLANCGYDVKVDSLAKGASTAAN